MRNFFKALASGFRAGLDQFRHRRAELQRDAALAKMMAELANWEAGSYQGTQWDPRDLAILNAREPGAIVFNAIESKYQMRAELNAIRDILHPPEHAADAEIMPTVFPLRGPQDAAS